MAAVKKIEKVRYPTKSRVNLAKRESHKRSITTAVVGVIIIAILCAGVVKLGVVDQFARLSEAESEYSAVHSQHMEMEEEIERYPQVEQEYRTYSRSWMTQDSENVSVDRMEVLDLMEDYLMSCGTVRSFSVQKDTVLVAMSGMNLEEISAMFSELQQQEIVSGASLTIASTADRTDEDLNFSVTIILRGEQEGEQ